METETNVDKDLQLISLREASRRLEKERPELYRSYNSLYWMATHGQLGNVVVKMRCHLNRSLRVRFGALVRALELMEDPEASTSSVRRLMLSRNEVARVFRLTYNEVVSYENRGLPCDRSTGKPMFCPRATAAWILTHRKEVQHA